MEVGVADGDAKLYWLLVTGSLTGWTIGRTSSELVALATVSYDVPWDVIPTGSPGHRRV